MIFGRGGGGGIINRVTKRATLSSGQQFIISRDTEGGTRGTADIDLAVTGAVGVRVNSVWEKGDSFRNDTEMKRYGINPTVGFAAGPGTRIDLSYEYFHDRRTTDRGVPSLSGRPLEGYDRTFFGDPNNSWADADVQIASLGAEHRFSDALRVRHRTQFADYDKFYQNVYPSSAVNAATDSFTIGAYNSRNDRQNLISQTDLIWNGRLLGIDQTLLVGFEAGRQRSRNQRLSGTIAGGNRVSLDDPTVAPTISYARGASDADNRTRATFAAGYVQTQLRPTDTLEIVAGLRFDRFRLSVDDERPDVATFARTDRLWSPRLGLVFKPAGNLSLYGSYSRSYLPQSGDQFSGLNPTTAALKPERFDNVEVGAKWEPVDGLLATAAIYQLDRTNTQARDAQDRVVLTGATRTRGLELGLERSITDEWQVSAGYALQDSEITEATTACNTADCDVPLVPRHSFSLWTKYQFTRPFAAGLGVLARSRSYASISNLVELPAYARLDGALYYRLAPGIQAQLNLENLLNRNYFPTAHNDNNIAPGAPRTARLTLRADF
jgi:catecholate siderophore receptor